VNKPLILFGSSPPPYGGVSVFLDNLFSHLRAYGVRWWTYLGSHTADEQVERFDHRRLGIVRVLFKQGRNARIVDFSHFHLEYPNLILLPIWLSAKVLLGFYWYKYILDGSLPVRYRQFTSVQRLMFRRAIDAIDEFIVVNDYLANWLKEEIRVRQDVTVIPCLLNIPGQVFSKEISPHNLEQLLPFLARQKKVCVIGTFIPAYGFAHAANAVEKLREQTAEDIGLLLLDGAFATDEDYRELVLTNRSWITVLTNVPNPEVYAILRHCDLFVRAVVWESYGISRVEAIWCGVPVIATNIGETRGMLTYEFGDEKKLMELIETVLNGRGHLDLPVTAELFRTEANQNLQKFVETIKLNPASLGTGERL
jgi:glycosyltransferase involved in cell wall biosynthesis